MTTVTDYTAILNGPTWWGTGVTGKPVFLTYSFSTSLQPYVTATAIYTQAFLDSFTPLTTHDMALARAALARWAAVSGITFFEVPAGQGDLQFSSAKFSLSPTYATSDGASNFPSSLIENDLAGDVFIDSDSNGFTENVWLYLHEIGHALGLKHPFDGGTAGNQTFLPDSLNNRGTTVMAERPPANPSTDPVNTGQLDAMDITAIQYLYGDPGSDGTQVASLFWDAANYVLSQTGYETADLIRGVHVADVIHGAGGNDLIYADAGDDRVYGETGDDVIQGGNGANMVDGGDGDDRLVVAGARSAFAITPYANGDIVVLGGSETDAIRNVEKISFHDQTVTPILGTSADDLLTATAADDIMVGVAGTDTALFFGSRASYDIQQRGEATRIYGPGGTDMVSGVETFAFGDESVDGIGSVWQHNAVDSVSGFGPSLGAFSAAPEMPLFAAGTWPVLAALS